MKGMEEQFIKSTGLPPIESAGGLIVGSAGAVLFILKNGKWDLPKGLVERECGYEETALREVFEETSINLDKVEIVAPLCPTWHTTRYGAQKYVKKTHWFMMRYSGNGEEVRPQLEEGITECRWIRPQDFSTYHHRMRSRIRYLTSFWKRAFIEE